MIDDLPAGAREAFEDTFEIEHSDDIDAAIDEVRKGDADVAVEMKGDTLVAHYTLTDQVKAGITQGALQAFVQGSNVALLAQAAGEPPTLPARHQAGRGRLPRHHPVRHARPAGLGGRDERGVRRRGDAAGLAAVASCCAGSSWRRSPPAPSSAPGSRSPSRSRSCRWRSSSASGRGAFGLVLTGSWWMAIPLLVVGTLCFMAIGLFAGAVTTTVEGAVNAANFIVLPMAFLSGSFFPLDAAPGWLRTVSNLLPLKHLNEAMLDVMVRGEGPAAALVPLAILAAFAIVVTLVVGAAVPVGN